MVPARRLLLPILISLFLISSLFLTKQALAIWVFDFDPPTLCVTFDDTSLNQNCPTPQTTGVFPYTTGVPPYPITLTDGSTTATFICDDGTSAWSSGCKSLTYKIYFYKKGVPDNVLDETANIIKTCNNDDSQCDLALKDDPINDPKGELAKRKIVVKVPIAPLPNHLEVRVQPETLDNAGNNKSLDYRFNSYPYKISGFIWIDDNGNGTQQPGENSCYTGSATIILTGSLLDNKTFNFTRVTQPCDTYSFNVPAGSYTVGLSLTGWTVTASPPAITTPPDKTDANFGVTVKTWWQTKLGNVRAATGKLDDVIPSFCTLPQCTPYVSLTGNNSPGIVSTATNFSLGAGRTNEFNWNVIDRFSNPTVYSYDYVNNQVSQPLPFTGAQPATSGTYKSDISRSIDSAWNITADKKIVILVNGNLTINRNVQVANGGFLAFYVSGDILVDPSIGTNFNNSTNFNLQGIYIADSSFKTGELQSCSVGNNRLNVAGTIVIDANADGIGNLEQKRCLTAQQSQTYPAFYVEYRPDFLLSAPSTIQQSSFVWQEIAP